MTLQELFEEYAALKQYRPGEIIFKAGEAGIEMYLIQSGEVEIHNGKNLLRTLKPGDLFGEMALIGNEPRSATAIAKTHCNLIPVDENRFLFLVRQNPYFSLYVMEILATRLRSHV